VVLISGSGTNLQTLIDATRQGSINGRIVAVISNKPGVRGLERAQSADIPALTVDHRDFQRREDFDAALAEQIESHRADLVILAGFMRILTPGFVNRFAGRMMNIHPSLLPRYPGLDTHRRAIDAGDREAGATVHFVTEELDGGPAIVQARVPIHPDDTPATLAARVLEKEHLIYPYAVKLFCEGRLGLTGQGATLDGTLLPRTGLAYLDP
jgi:phosphoribosylglycinamide formyltransferase-1